jgi:hypothetical protein
MKKESAMPDMSLRFLSLLVVAILPSVFFVFCYYDNLSCVISSRVSISAEELPTGASGFLGKVGSSRECGNALCRSLPEFFPFVVATMAALAIVAYVMRGSSEGERRALWTEVGIAMLVGIFFGIAALGVPIAFKSIMAV